jgi:hypothetical protein
VLRFVTTYVAVPVVHFISLELLRGSPLRCWLIANLGLWAVISVLRVKAVIHLALKVVGAMKPRTRANEGAGIKPLRTKVSVGSTVIRGVVIVTVGTIGGGSYIDGDLSRSLESAMCHGEYGNSGYREKLDPVHEFSSQSLGPLFSCPNLYERSGSSHVSLSNLDRTHTARANPRRIYLIEQQISI